MPSEAFMKSVLSSDQARLSRGEVITEEQEEQVVPSEEDVEEEAPDQEEDVDTDAGDDEGADADEDLGEEPGDDEEGESEDEPEAEQEFYLGRFKTREDAEKGWEETNRYAMTNAKRAAEQEKRISELEQFVAYMQQQSVNGTDDSGFEEWADERIEADPERGMIEAIQASVESGDQSYAYAYCDRWAETDPYLASVWRNQLQNDVFAAQRAEQPQPQAEEQGARDVIDQVWRELALEYSDINDPEARHQIVQIITHTPHLDGAIRSADPSRVRDGFLSARHAYSLRRNGPRRVRSSDAEQVAQAKRRATVATGDGAPQRRPSNPEFTAMEESILAGADRLGLKRRDQQ